MSNYDIAHEHCQAIFYLFPFFMDTLLERLRIVRDSLGLSQSDFAKKLGISQGHVSGLENGLRQPSDQLITAVCHAFGINEDWLREGKGEMYAADRRPEGNAGVVRLDPHQRLVSGFVQRDLALRINQKLLELELLAPEDLEEIEEIINLRLRRRRKEPPPKKTKAKSE